MNSNNKDNEKSEDNIINNSSDNNSNSNNTDTTTTNNNNIKLNFKKKDKVRNLRKKDNNSDNNKSNENEEENQDEENILELTKEKQKLREKGKGLNVGVLAEGPHIKHSFRELENKLDDSFTVHNEDKQEVNIHLEKYINEKIEEKKKLKQQQQNNQTDNSINNNNNNNNNNSDNNNSSSGNNNSQSINEASLFETPDHLKRKEKQANNEDKTNWVAGIAEVQLPETYKYKNMLETEKARELLDRDAPRSERLNTPQNFNQNYQYHNRFIANKKRSEDKATDQEAVDNFRKRFRY